VIGRLRHKRKARGVPAGKEKRKAQQESRSTRATTQTRTKRTKRFRTEKTTVPDQNDDSSGNKPRRFRAKELRSSIPDSVRNRPPENAELSLSYAGSIFLGLVTSDYLFLFLFLFFNFLILRHLLASQEGFNIKARANWTPIWGHGKNTKTHLNGHIRPPTL